MNPYLEKFIPLVDFLGEILGNDTEIALHDLTDIDNSIIAISHKHISGRDIGSPATNFALKAMKDVKYKNIDYVANYRGYSESGKILKSSSYFIKDDKRQIIGMLCINIDYEKFTQFRNYLDSMIQIPEENEEDIKMIDKFSHTVEELAFDSIQTAIEDSGISPERMSQEEKIEIVKRLNENGVFLLKGTVSKVAAVLKVSEATVYRYLNTVRAKGE